jgi:hypothetical protein
MTFVTQKTYVIQIENDYSYKSAGYFSYIPLISYSQHYMYMQIFSLLGIRKSALLRKLEYHVYICSTITLIVPLSAIIRAGTVQVTYD